jgi:hypothetical protein
MSRPVGQPPCRPSPERGRLMLYDMVNANQAPKAPDAQGVLGYWYNHGGLNNQKMALVGLILSAIRDRRPVNLPYVYNKDLRTEQEHLVRLENVFDLDAIRDFAGRHGVPVHSACPSGERGGWDYFGAFQAFISTPADRLALETALGAIRGLKPRIASHTAFLDLKNFVFNSLGIDTVVQFRIESDWRGHFEHTLRPILGDSEDNGIGFLEILSKIRNTFPNLRILYATSDENAMLSSKNEIREACRSRFGIELLWKSDLLDPSLTAQLTPLDLSLIDFEIAKYSRRFVGLTSSTFSNMLGIEKFAGTGQQVTGHYIYNRLGDVVVERKDNGFTASSHLALSPPAAVALLEDHKFT